MIHQRRAPGPRGHFLVGSIPEFRRDPLALMRAAAAEHGDVVRLAIGPLVVHVLRHPDHVKHVLVDHQHNFDRRTRSVASFREVLGRGLLSSEEDFWRRQRRIAQPAFHRRRIGGMAALMVGAAERAAEALVDGPAEVDLVPVLLAMSLRVQGLALFGADLAGEADHIADAVDVVQRAMTDRMRAIVPVPRALPTAANRRFRAALARLDACAAHAIASRRAGQSSLGDGGADLLALLMDARDADTGEGMSDRQLRDELLTLLVAGHETAAMALAWTFHLLARHAPARARLEAELDGALDGRPPAVEDLARLPFTARVVDEALRLYPPVWALERSVIGDDVIGGYPIPAGSTVMLSPFLTHRSPTLWRDPDAFDPDRFLDDGARAKHAWFPFGGGPHLCIGAAFARTQLVLSLAAIARRVRLHRPDEDPVPEPLITLRPRGGLPVTVEKR